MVSYLAIAAVTPLTAISISSYLARQYPVGSAIFSASVALLVILQLGLIFCFHAYVYPYYFSPMRNIPLPPGPTWWGGHAFLDIGRGKEHGSEVRKWVKTVPNNGLIRAFDLFHRERLFVVSPAAHQEILNTYVYNFEKPRHFKTGSTRLILGMGVLMAEGDAHKLQRKQLNPAFNYRHIKDLYPRYWDVSLELVNSVANRVDRDKGETIIEPNEQASLVTLDILGRTGLGIDFGAIQNPNNSLTSAYRGLFDNSVLDVAFTIAELILPERTVINLPVKRNRLLKERTGLIRQECRRIIQQKRVAVESSNGEVGSDILSAVLSGKTVSFTDDEMVEQLVTFLVAGHETTAGAFAWTIHAFCRNGSWQQRLREEVWAHIPATAWSADPHERTSVTADMVEDMPLLKAFCSEILRLYPPVPATLRTANKDIVICGHNVPKGCEIIIAPWMVNVHPELWGEEPEVFKPERWLENGNGGAKSNYSNMTFLHGPRSCIGQAFARGEFACIVAVWVGALEVAWHKEPKLDKSGKEIGPWVQPSADFINGIAVRPTKGWKVKVRRATRP